PTVEGASDVVTFGAMSVMAIGRPSNRGGVTELADLMKNHELLVVGENDRKSDGSWPGKDGAIAVAQQLADRWQKPVKWTMPPEPAKDTRHWFQLQGAEGLDREELKGYGVELLDALTQSATEVMPTGVQKDVKILKEAWGAPIPLEAKPPPTMPSGIVTGWAGEMLSATA